MMGSEYESQSEPIPEPMPMMPPAPMPMMPPAPLQPETMKPVIAGVLLIVVAVMALMVALVFMGAVDIGLGALDEIVAEDTTGTATGMVDMLQGILMVCGIIFLVFALLAMLGGIMSIKRKSFGFAIVGAIFGIFTLGPYALGSILSIVALVLILLSKDEF